MNVQSLRLVRHLNTTLFISPIVEEGLRLGYVLGSGLTVKWRTKCKCSAMWTIHLCKKINDTFNDIRFPKVSGPIWDIIVYVNIGPLKLQLRKNGYDSWALSRKDQDSRYTRALILHIKQRTICVCVFYEHDTAAKTEEFKKIIFTWLFCREMEKSLLN